MANDPIEREAEVDFALPKPVKSDLEQLTEYLAGPYVRRFSDLADLHASALTYKWQCADILRKANFFHLEILGWLALAKRLYTEQYAESLTTTQSVERERVEEKSRTLRPTSGMIEAQARQEVSALEEAVERLEQTIRLLDKLASSAQSMLRTMSEDEFTGRAEGGPASGEGAWEDFRAAPIALALERLGARTQRSR